VLQTELQKASQTHLVSPTVCVMAKRSVWLTACGSGLLTVWQTECLMESHLEYAKALRLHSA